MKLLDAPLVEEDAALGLLVKQTYQWIAAHYTRGSAHAANKHWYHS